MIAPLLALVIVIKRALGAVRTTWAGGVTILLASAMHVGWGVILLVEQQFIWSTPIAGLWVATNWLPPRVRGPVVTLALFLTPTLAILGGGRRFRYTAFGSWLMVPQQIILVCSSVAALIAALDGRYPDATARAWTFILTDQLVTILLAPAYTAAILDYHWPVRTARRR